MAGPPSEVGPGQAGPRSGQSRLPHDGPVGQSPRDASSKRVRAEPSPHTLRVVSLRRWLPRVVFAAGLLSLLVLLGKLHYDYRHEVNEAAQAEAAAELRRTAYDLELALRRGAKQDLHSELAELRLNPAIMQAILLGADGVVLAAAEPGAAGRSVDDQGPGFPREAAQRVRQTGTPELAQAPDGRRLWALGPVTLQAGSGTGQAVRRGTLVLAYDLGPRIAHIWAQFREEALVFGVTSLLIVAALFWLAHHGIVRPAAILSAAMARIEAGDYTALPQFTGSGKFLDMSKALARMAAAIQARNAEVDEGQRRFRELADASLEAVVVHRQGRITNANGAAERLWSVPAGGLLGRDLFTLLAAHERARLAQRIGRRINGIWQVDIVDSAGQIVPTEASVRHLQPGPDGLTVASLHDLRERRAAQAEISRLTRFDALTGLASRHALLERVAEELAVCRAHARRACLATLNVVAFQAVNDSLGMEAGDAVLRLLARRMTTQQERGATLARLHSDHFALLSPDLPDDPDAAAVHAARCVERLLASIAEPIEIQGHALHLRATAGLVLIPNGERNATGLLRAAETAMHQADRQGPDQLHFFSRELQERAATRLRVRNELARALERGDELVLHYQPQVGANGQLLGLEALVRWQHPRRGMVSPASFVEEAEASGLIVPLGYWALEQATACLRRWQHGGEGHPWATGLTMSVNVSPRQFKEADFTRRVESLLARSGLPAGSLEIELTEGLLVDDLEAALQQMAELRRLGVRLALDDFGTGFSSLSYLRRLPIDTLKIDRSFVVDIDAPAGPEQGKRPTVLIEAIVAMGHRLGLRVLAEGVETDVQLAHLLRVGCDAFQGYRFSRALAEPQLHDWALHHRLASNYRDRVHAPHELQG